MAFAIIATTAGALVTGTPSRNPDLGLTEEERIALYAAGMERSIAGRQADLEAFKASGQDPRSLRRVELEIDADRPLPALSVAANSAALIVHARVTSLDFHMFDDLTTWASTSLEVKRTLKGSVDSGQTILMRSAGRPERGAGTTNDHVVYILGEVPSIPLLFEGDEAVFFLWPGPHPGTWSAQPFTGQYRILDGEVYAHKRNPFARSVDGLPVAEFMQLVRDAVAE